MKRASSTPLIKCGEESGEKIQEDGEENEGFLMARRRIQNSIDKVEGNDVSDRVHCISLYSHRRHSHDRADQNSMEKYGLWRQEQKSRAAKLEQQLKARWTLEDMIDEQLNRFHNHYNRAMVPTQFEDVAQILMPKGAPPLEMASVGWLGDWRPSAILELLRALARSSYLSSSVADSVETDRILSQLINEVRIEETVLDEEMAEIQATCILHLPFSPINQTRGSPLAQVQSELKKTKQVIIKAQQLRFKALELVMKKVLSQVDAAEFLVAFAGIQDAIHQFAARQKFQKSPVSVSVKVLGSV